MAKKTLAAVTSVVATLLVIMGCGKRQDSIHFIIPAGFRGEIRITEDKTNGVLPLSKDGTITISVPPNGQVVLKDWAPLFREHRESSSYADGTTIPNPNFTPAGQQFPPDKVVFWALGTTVGTGYPQETVVYFVGTDDERKKPR